MDSTNSLAIENKWDKIHANSSRNQAAKILVKNRFLLPKQGKALDLASGLGANALLLAEHGLDTHAWDISSVALKKLQLFALKKHLNLSTKQVVIKANSLPKNTFDVIIITRFLDRSLTNGIMESLKMGGLLFYQTYVRDKIDSNGPNNPNFLLARNELLRLFQPLTLVSYRENNLIGALEFGERNEALYIGQKPKKIL
ncbi:MAG: methyltransferase domain-containing protein [Methylococcaceae bacterium]|nr:methyltransferase domain-containing protein [Methylococcaceae bacterium]